MADEQPILVKIDPKAYAEVIEGLIEHVGASPELNPALHDYFVSAITKGADISAIDLPALAQMSEEKLAEAAVNLPDKVSQNLRKESQDSAALRKNLKLAALFGEDSDLKLKELEGGEQAQTLEKIIDAKIAEYNETAKNGIRRNGKNYEIFLPDRQGNNPSWKNLRGDFIHFIQKQPPTKETWLLLNILEKAASQQAEIAYNPQKTMRLADIMDRQLFSLDDYNPKSLRVVFTSKPESIVEMSSGQRWTSCMNEEEERVNYIHFTQNDITYGTIVAYLVAEDDPQARYPLARQLLKPYQNQQTKETIYIPAHIYPAARSPNTYKLFEQTTDNFVQQFNQGKIGEFVMNKNLYSDGQTGFVNIGEQEWDRESVNNALQGYYQSNFTEYLTELNIHRENPQRVTSLLNKMKQLHDPYRISRNLFKDLAKSHGEGTLPNPQVILDVAKNRIFDLDLRLAQNELPANLEQVLDIISESKIGLTRLNINAGSLKYGALQNLTDLLKNQLPQLDALDLNIQSLIFDARLKSPEKINARNEQVREFIGETRKSSNIGINIYAQKTLSKKEFAEELREYYQKESDVHLRWAGRNFPYIENDQQDLFNRLQTPRRLATDFLEEYPKLGSQYQSYTAPTFREILESIKKGGFSFKYITDKSINKDNSPHKEDILNDFEIEEIIKAINNPNIKLQEISIKSEFIAAEDFEQILDAIAQNPHILNCKIDCPKIVFKEDLTSIEAINARNARLTAKIKPLEPRLDLSCRDIVNREQLGERLSLYYNDSFNQALVDLAKNVSFGEKNTEVIQACKQLKNLQSPQFIVESLLHDKGVGFTYHPTPIPKIDVMVAAAKSNKFFIIFIDDKVDFTVAVDAITDAINCDQVKIDVLEVHENRHYQSNCLVP